MATVERIVAPSVALQPLPNVRVTSRLDPNFAQPLVQGVHDLGGAVTHIIEQEQEKADTASLLEAQRKMGDWERSWFDPSNASGVYAHKGKEALGLPEKIDPDFEKVKSEVGSNIHGAKAREVFEQWAMGRRESLLDRVNSYAVKEHEGYVSAEMDAGILNSAEAGARARLDGRWQDADAEMRRGLGILQARAKFTGMSPDALAVATRAYASSVHATTINGYLVADRAEDANAYMTDHAEEMSTEDLLRAMEHLRPALIDAAAYKMVDGLNAGVTPSAMGADNVSVETLWPALVHQESRGNQGAVSPKGALSLAQIMPTTGPEAAALAGVPWSLEKLKNDPQYATQLGQAYLAKQIDTYGSAPLALAAYNAGPGKVNEWLRQYGDPRQGKISVADFVAAIPYKETKKYVTTIMERTGAGAVVQAPTEQSVSVTLQSGKPRTLPEQLAALKGLKPSMRQAMERVVIQQHSIAEQAQQDAERETSRDIYGIVNALPPGTDWRKAVTPQQRVFADRMNMSGGLDNIVEQRSKGTPQVTPPDLHLNLLDIMQRARMGDAAAAAEVGKMNPYDPRLSMAEEDRNTLANLQVALKNGDKKTMAAQASDAEITQTIATFGTQNLGITKAQLKDDRDAQARFNNFNQQMRLWINDYSGTHQGRAPTYRELQEHADALTFKVPAKVGVIGTTTDIPALEFTGNADAQVPREHAARLTEQFKKTNNGRAPTPRELKRAYMIAVRAGVL